jgi:hypothetical protein
MKKISFWILGMANCLAPVQTLFAQEVIPDQFSSIAVEAPDSYEFVKGCMPTISESSFNQSIREAGDRKIVTTWPADKTKPYLVVAKGRAYCVKMSAQKYPVLPLAVFDETINFPDMPKDEAKKFRADLSKQLAMTGIATALVVNDAGNAYQVGYLFSSNMPLKFYYRAGFLKKGEFVETDFRSVYRALGGGMAISGRGQPAENFKFFF